MDIDLIHKELEKKDWKIEELGQFDYALIADVAEVVEKQLTIPRVSCTFKAKIEQSILELKSKLEKVSKDVEMSFTEPEKWKKEMHLINGEIEGLNKALNYC